jgi:uncharacterized protein (TIGR02246 family)
MAADERLEARLRRLEDLEEIRALIADYRRQLDRRDFAAYAALFTRDGEFVGNLGRAQTPAGIQAMLEAALGPNPEPPGPTQYHLVANSLIEVDGDEAHGTSTFAVIRREDGDQPALQLLGEYDDTFAREDGRWRFRRRVAHVDVPARRLGA